MGIRLNREQMEQIARNLEANGGDATELKEYLEESSRKTGIPTFESFLKQATITEGEDLICCLCQNMVNKLYNDTCYTCFQNWITRIIKEKEKRVGRD